MQLLARSSGPLPFPKFKCKRCAGALRASFVARLKDWFIICDHCERGAMAPRSMHDQLEEFVNAAD